ncbi:MAG: prepilin-type N-terminal cleavage/methylation domain-containing protein [Gemmatimonadota bacterium]|nr:prepilin-type N-terminal cleavage/methylation domain-containing protein [Gemmatimonadota bacterium]
MRRRRLAQRRGMTLFEVIIALVILATVMLGMGNFIVRFVRSTRTASVVSTASDLVGDRIESVKSATVYAGIDSMATTEASIPSYPGFTRQTQITHTGGNAGDLVDYRTVTVTVTGNGMSTPIKKSTFIAKF